MERSKPKDRIGSRLWCRTHLGRTACMTALTVVVIMGAGRSKANEAARLLHGRLDGAFDDCSGGGVVDLRRGEEWELIGVDDHCFFYKRFARLTDGEVRVRAWLLDSPFFASEVRNLAGEEEQQLDIHLHRVRPGEEREMFGAVDDLDPDDDDDGTPDWVDNCPDHPNPDQLDTDRDGQGLACDRDDDGDGVDDTVDNCPLVSNPDQLNTDGHGAGDACEADRDGDGYGDEVDNCPDVYNPGQEDMDLDHGGDLCDPDPEDDGVVTWADNCPYTWNPDQANADRDVWGDACDPNTLDLSHDGPVQAEPPLGESSADGVEEHGAKPILHENGPVGSYTEDPAQGCSAARRSYIGVLVVLLGIIFLGLFKLSSY